MLNDNNKGIASQKFVISENLEKDIKILIKYILFKKEFQDTINISKKESIYKSFQNCYLMNMILFLRYKSYFFYQELVNIINEETVNLNQIKDKSLNCDENLINKIFDSLLEIFSSKNDFYKKDVADEITYNLDNINILEIATNRIDYKGISIIYPEFFDIVDGTIYNDLIMRLNIEKIGFVKCELIINKGIIIIKNEENNNGFYLLIGKILEDNRFELKNLIIFDEEKYRKEFFENFLKNSYEEIMEKYNLKKMKLLFILMIIL